jgi:hypothetical protein
LPEGAANQVGTLKGVRNLVLELAGGDPMATPLCPLRETLGEHRFFLQRIERGPQRRFQSLSLRLYQSFGTV